MDRALEATDGEEATHSRTLADVASEPTTKMLIYGGPKRGKTRFLLSVVNWLDEETDYTPDEVSISFLDLDGGVMPHIRRGFVSEDWTEAIRYHMLEDFYGVKETTEEELSHLQQVRNDHGQNAAWILVDNMEAMWQWAREAYAMDVYGMPMNELAKEKRRQAKKEGKRTKPTFDQLADYSVITPMHNKWAESIKNSGINFVWSAPEKDVYDGNESTGDVKPGGQKDNPHRVDHIVHLYKKTNKDGSKEKYLARLDGTRAAMKKFKGMPDPSFARFQKFLDKVSEE